MINLLGKLTRRVWGERRRRSLWALPFSQNVRFEFSATCSGEWNSIFQNFQKRGQPHEVYLNFPNFSFDSTLLPEFLEFFGWIVRISEIQQFPEFLKTFPENFCTICRCFQIFQKFWLNEKRSLSPAFPPPFPSPNHARPYFRDVPGTL